LTRVNLPVQDPKLFSGIFQALNPAIDHVKLELQVLAVDFHRPDFIFDGQYSATAAVRAAPAGLPVNWRAPV
jgi:hypothetical protein